MKSTTLSLIVIRADNLEQTLAFYRTIGVEFIREQHGSGPVHYSCKYGEIVLELYPTSADSQQEQSADTTMLGFKVVSLENTLRELKDLGVSPKTAPKESDWGRWVNVADPGGRTIQLSEATNI